MSLHARDIGRPIHGILQLVGYKRYGMLLGNRGISVKEETNQCKRSVYFSVMNELPSCNINMFTQSSMHRDSNIYYAGSRDTTAASLLTVTYIQTPRLALKNGCVLFSFFSRGFALLTIGFIVLLR